MSHELPGLKPIWVWSIAPFFTGVVTLIDEKLVNVRTSRLRLASQSDVEIHETPLQTSALKPAALSFGPDCSWPVRICRAACSTAESRAVEAMNIAPSSKMANSRARNGMETSANSTAVAPPFADANAPTRWRADGRSGDVGRGFLAQVRNTRATVAAPP